MVGGSPGTPASSTKTGCHDIAEILLKMAFKTKNQSKQKHNTIYVGHRYTQTNTNNVNKI
jgi:hypothetical protein